MVAVIAAGLAVGVIGSLPLAFHGRLVRRRRARGADTTVAMLMGLVTVSLVFLSLAIFLSAVLFDSETAASFAIAAIAGFLGSVLVSTIFAFRGWTR